MEIRRTNKSSERVMRITKGFLTCVLLMASTVNASSLEELAGEVNALPSYESQLAGTSSHVEHNAKLSEGIQELLSNLNASIEDTKNYKDNIAELSKSLAALNQVYGNMLNAMNPSSNS